MSVHIIRSGPLTNALCVVNLAIAVAFMILPVSWWEQLVMAGSVIPSRMAGEFPGFAGQNFSVPVFLTPFTAAFLHGGIAHAAMNVLMLFLVGRMVEPVLGWPRLLLLYVIGAYAAALAEYLAAPASNMPVVGASGAMSAVIAAYVMLFPNKPAKPWGPIPAKIARPLHLIIGWVAINLMLAFAGGDLGVNIAIWSHVGGFVAGVFLAWPLLRWKYRKA